MTDASRRGCFITFEGCDGCGKTTQAALLARRLREEGRDVVTTVEPGGTKIGNQIRGILLNAGNQELRPSAELLLYFSARAQNVEEIILPALERGAIVISDRYTDSTMAYQGAARGLGRNVVETLHAIACRGLRPDLTILIDIGVETALERAGERNRQGADRDRMDEQARDFHLKVRDEYLRIAMREPDRVRVIDGRAAIEEVAARVWSAAAPLLH